MTDCYVRIKLVLTSVVCGVDVVLYVEGRWWRSEGGILEILSTILHAPNQKQFHNADLNVYFHCD